MGTFGSVLIKIIKVVNDDEVRLICFRQLWGLAYESDQWSVQKEVKEVFNDKYISESIATQLSEHILDSSTEVDMGLFSGLTLPKIVKGSILKGNEISEIKEKARKEKQELEDEEFEWE
jgi:hypothetical protein